MHIGFKLANLFFNSWEQSAAKAALCSQERYYTYQELYGRVANIYHHLKTAKITAPHIGVYGGNNFETVASIIAISAYGAAYVPLNPQFPSERNKFMVQDCSLEVALSTQALEEDTLGKDCHIIETTPLANVPLEATISPILNQKIAYILYTSGSTGQPKGVPVSHQNIAHFLDFMQKTYQFQSTDRFLQMFDWTVQHSPYKQ